MSDSKWRFFVYLGNSNGVLSISNRVILSGASHHHGLGVGVLFMRVQMNPLGEPLQTNETQVGFLPTVDQLMPLKLAGGGEPLVTKLAAILFVELFFQHGQLKRKGNV
jgi:hypothetical protein